MRVWLLQGRQGEDAGALRAALRQLGERPGCSGWRMDVCPLSSDLAARILAQRPEVLLFAAALFSAPDRVDEVLPLDVGLVVAADEGQADTYRDLAEHHAVTFVSPQPAPEALALALRSAQAALRRQQSWRTRVEQLNQRLNDRIVIERAKGVLVQRLGIGEEEAYRRLRVLSRRQRRQIRDIAQSLLDTQALLLPEANGIADPGEAAKPPQDPPELPAPKSEGT